MKRLQLFSILLLMITQLLHPTPVSPQRPWWHTLFVNRVEASALPSSTYTGVKVVAKTGGDYTSIQTALNNITANSTNRYLIWVAPGTYSEKVTMESYVDIMGAGQNLTFIASDGSATNPSSGSGAATVIGASNATLSFLTVRSSFTDSQADTPNGFMVGIYASGTSPNLTHIAVAADGAASANYGIYVKSSAAPTVAHVSITASADSSAAAYGVYSNSSDPSIAHLTVSISSSSSGTVYGIQADSYSGTISFVTVNVTSSGVTNSITYGISIGNGNGGHTANLSYIKAIVSGGAVYNRGIHLNGNSVVLEHATASASGGQYALGINTVGIVTPSGGYPVSSLRYVTASASSGTTNSAGIYNESGTPNMYNVTATADGNGTTTNYGLYNTDGNNEQTRTLDHVIASASGGANSYGMYVLLRVQTGTYGSILTVKNSTITASGATATTGIFNDSGGYNHAETVRIENSRIAGTTTTLNNANNYTIKIGFSQLDGGDTTGTGTFTCVLIYSESYGYNHSACP